MSSQGDIVRLNVLIELFADCANAADLDAMLHIVMGRLRWVVDFDRCVFVLARDGERVCWVRTRTSEALSRIELSGLLDVESTLIDRVFDSGAPTGLAPGRICVPIQVVGRTIGAIFFRSETTPYSYRDLRLGNHAGQYLGSIIARLDLEENARRVSRRKDDLLAMLGHELRNPLSPITTAVQLLRARADGAPSKELEVIHRQTQHLVRLVDDLLDVARLTRGKMTLRREPVEVAQVVALAIEIVGPLLEQRRHTLTVDVPALGLVIDGDVNRLAQVVSNLLSNAAHYTNPGGHLGVAATRDGDTVVLEVCDDGVGIPAEAMADIFDLFVQGQDRADARGGLGLGLVVVRELTELHGGSVSVASRGPGRGTQFTVRLPALPAGSVAVAPPEASLLIPAATAGRRVLLVDDNEDARDLLAMLLRKAGHEVTIARDGLDALGLLDEVLPSVAVLDINMPVMDGYELAERIRGRFGEDELFLVALTGYGQPSDHERSRAAGFNEHLVKPIDLTQLLRAIARS